MPYVGVCLTFDIGWLLTSGIRVSITSHLGHCLIVAQPWGFALRSLHGGSAMGALLCDHSMGLCHGALPWGSAAARHRSQSPGQKKAPWQLPRGFSIPVILKGIFRSDHKTGFILFRLSFRL